MNERFIAVCEGFSIILLLIFCTTGVAGFAKLTWEIWFKKDRWLDDRNRDSKRDC